MGYSIDELKGVISKGGGVAKTNVFRVILPPLGGVAGQDQRSINLLCKAVNVPGKSVATADRKIGPTTQKIANGVIFADVNLTFMVLNDFGIKNYFNTWSDLAIDPNNFMLGYKQNYAKSVYIQALKPGVGLPVYKTALGIPKLPTSIQNRLPKIGPFDFAQGELNLNFLTSDDVSYEVELEGAFPTAVTGIDMNNDADGIAEITISMSYTKWKSKTQKSNPMSDLVELGLGSLASRVGQLI